MTFDRQDIPETPTAVSTLSPNRMIGFLLDLPTRDVDRGVVFGAARSWVRAVKVLLAKEGYTLSDALVLFDSSGLTTICVEIVYQHRILEMELAGLFVDCEVVPKAGLLAFIHRHPLRLVL